MWTWDLISLCPMFEKFIIVKLWWCLKTIPSVLGRGDLMYPYSWMIIDDIISFRWFTAVNTGERYIQTKIVAFCSPILVTKNFVYVFHEIASTHYWLMIGSRVTLNGIATLNDNMHISTSDLCSSHKLEVVKYSLNPPMPTEHHCQSNAFPHRDHNLS